MPSAIMGNPETGDHRRKRRLWEYLLTGTDLGEKEAVPQEFIKERTLQAAGRGGRPWKVLERQ